MPWCNGHAERAAAAGLPDKLYASNADPENLPEDGVRKYFNFCYDVQASVVENIPEDATRVPVSDEPDYASCQDCTHGYLCVLCPGQEDEPGAADAPDYYWPKGDYDGESGFRVGILCYQVTGTLELMPAGAKIYIGDELSCEDCGSGIQWIRCELEPAGDEEYWSTKDDIDAFKEAYPDIAETGSVTNRINNVCHTLNLDASFEPIPLDVERHIIQCGWPDCFSCFCPQNANCEEIPETGIPVYFCADEAVELIAWLAEADIPDDTTYFEYKERCFFVDPSEPPREIPDGATIVKMEILHSDCGSCKRITCQGICGGGAEPYDPCQRYPQGSPFRPWWCDSDPPREGEGNKTKWQRLSKCVWVTASSSWTFEESNFWTRVRDEMPTTVRLGWECYKRMGAIVQRRVPPGQVFNISEYTDKGDCDACAVYNKLTRCDTGEVRYATRKEILAVYDSSTPVLGASDSYCYEVTSNAQYFYDALVEAGAQFVTILDSEEDCCLCDPTSPSCPGDCDNCDELPSTYTVSGSGTYCCDGATGNWSASGVVITKTQSGPNDDSPCIYNSDIDGENIFPCGPEEGGFQDFFAPGILRLGPDENGDCVWSGGTGALFAGIGGTLVTPDGRGTYTLGTNECEPAGGFYYVDGTMTVS